MLGTHPWSQGRQAMTLNGYRSLRSSFFSCHGMEGEGYEWSNHGNREKASPRETIVLPQNLHNLIMFYMLPGNSEEQIQFSHSLGLRNSDSFGLVQSVLSCMVFCKTVVLKIYIFLENCNLYLYLIV